MTWVLALCLALAPRHDRALLASWAEAIAAATQDAEERRQLVVTAFHETGFRLGCRRCVPFGWMGHRAGMSLTDDARGALRTLRRGLRWCGSAEPAFGLYRLGRCSQDGESASRMRSLRRLRRVRAVEPDGAESVPPEAESGC